METKRTQKPEQDSLMEKFINSFGLRRALLLLFGIIYLIKNYIKSEFLSNSQESGQSIWDDKKPVLPSKDPLFYETSSQSEVFPNRMKLALKIFLFLLLGYFILRRLNSFPQKAQKNS